MDLSIIVVSWNTKDLITECLRSLEKELQDWTGRAEIIVVDNGSTDGTQAALKKRFPRVRLIQNKKNLGFAAANNIGMRAAHGRFFLLLNSDTKVFPGAVPTLFRFVSRRPRVGAAGARLLNPDGTLQVSCYPSPTLLREFWRLFHLDRFYRMGSYDMEAWAPDKPRPVDTILGACMLLRKSVLEQIGLMDESYFMYSEEIDLCQRIRLSGGEVYWVPAAVIEHRGGSSTSLLRDEMFLLLYRSKILYFRKFYGHLGAALYKILLFTAGLARILISPFSGWFHPEKKGSSRRLASSYARLIRRLPGLEAAAPENDAKIQEYSQ